MSAITAKELASRLGLPEPGAEGAVFELLALYREDYARFKEALEARPVSERARLALDVFTHAAAETKERYDALGLPEEVFWAGAEELQLWRRDCLRKTGEEGLLNLDWPRRFLNLEIFRLGRLEYEARELSEDIRVAHAVYPAGTPCLDAHIPADEPLLLSAVHYSFASAPLFYREYFGKDYQLLHCASWLLAPELIGLLPAESNIMQFQRNFTLYGLDYSVRQAEERVFGTISNDIETYPEETSLQRTLKAYLLNGGKVAVGKGILPLTLPAEDQYAKLGAFQSCCGACGGC